MSDRPDGRSAGRGWGGAAAAGLAVALVLAGLWSLAGRDDRTPSHAPLEGWNLVLVLIDTLRADHLGFAGHARPTSPHLDALAEQAVVFEQAMAPSSYTRESVVSLFTGRMPSRGGTGGWRTAPLPEAPHLGERLREAGYRTGFFSNSVMLRNPGFTRGFEEAEHLSPSADLSGEGPRLSQRALRFVREARSRPFALYLHYLDPHAPYDPGEDFLAGLGAEPPAAPLDLYREVAAHLPALRADGFGPGDPRFEALRIRYEAEIRATDAAVATLLRGLDAEGVLDRTLVVVTADHGEEFLEHGGIEHGWTLARESIHVPLLFAAPGALAPARVAERVSLVDVLPSLAQLLGLPLGDPAASGTPLFALDAGAARPSAAPRALVAEMLLLERNVVRAVIRDDWKYVEAHRWLDPEARAESYRPARRRVPPPPLPASAEPVHRALYDLARDPDEQHDRLAEQPERARALAALLAREAPLVAERGADPAPPVSSEERERLRALGYH